MVQVAGSLRQRMLSSWSRTRPTARLIVGALLITSVGYLGLTPKALFGVKLIWPHAALWGAMGWGFFGLSFRPMIILAVLGFAQDVTFNAPFGSFLLINLTAYGLSAWSAELFDVENEERLSIILPPIAIGGGFLALWILASNSLDRGVAIGPVLQPYIVTVILYYPLAGLFDLGNRRNVKTRGTG